VFDSLRGELRIGFFQIREGVQQMVRQHPHRRAPISFIVRFSSLVRGVSMQPENSFYFRDDFWESLMKWMRSWLLFQDCVISTNE
jgi:hypothetical protein